RIERGLRMDNEEAYSDDKLVSGIAESLFKILEMSPRPELMARCFEKTEVEDEDEFKEMIEKKLRVIFHKPPKKKKPAAAPHTPQKKEGEEGGKEGKKEIKEEVVEEEKEDEEEDWQSSSDEFNMSYEDTDLDETDFQSDSEVKVPPTFMMGTQWTQAPPPFGRPMTPPSLHCAPSPSDENGRDDFDSPSHYGTPPKMPRLEMQDVVSLGEWSGDSQSDETDTHTLIPSNHQRHMSGSGSAPIRPGSPAPWTVPIPTARRILGELPLEKDEFDSSSDDDVERPSQPSNIPMDSRYHPPSLPYPTATPHTTTGNSLNGRNEEFPLGLMPQDENNPGGRIGMVQSLPPSSLFSPPIGASSSHPLDIQANRDFSPSIPIVTSSLPIPSAVPYEFDDREFDSD
ncbi:hypothetical protein PENTCL1PPCAC_22372, partial [Pristionchus entomophagus]